jgi:plasmid stabilization system protein ParE
MDEVGRRAAKLIRKRAKLVSQKGGDAQVVQSLLHDLEDRRVLFVSYAREDGAYVILSVLHMRRQITDHLRELTPSAAALVSFRRMRAACRAFLDARREGEGLDQLEADLERLRVTFGAELRALSDDYNLEVDGELRRIVP